MTTENNNTCGNAVKDEKKTPCETKIQMHEMMAIADVLDGEDAVTIWFEIPGASKDTVTIEVKDRVMRVRAESCLHKGGIPIAFHREFQLSECINIQGITATTQDGVLTLTLPKSEHAKVHRIKVS